MITEYATPADFDRWRSHAETLDVGTLRHIIMDCRQAATNMRSFNTVREGFYEDQAFTYADELARRRKLSCS
jgi:hypothetical protein